MFTKIKGSAVGAAFSYCVGGMRDVLTTCGVVCVCVCMCVLVCCILVYLLAWVHVEVRMFFPIASPPEFSIDRVSH